MAFFLNNQRLFCRLLLSLILVIGWVFTSRGQSVSQVSLEKLKGVFHQEKFIKAEKLVNKYLLKAPSDPVLHFWKGKILMHFEEYIQAYSSFKQAQNLDPFYAEAYEGQGDLKYRLAFLLLSRPEICGSCGLQILPSISSQIHPNDYVLAAIQDYLKALSVSSKTATIYSKLGFCYDRLGNHLLACQYMKKADLQGHKEARRYLNEGNCP